LFTSFAQDAVFSVYNIWDYIKNDNISNLVNAIRYNNDSIDLYIQEYERLNPSDTHLEKKILTHKLMQQELYRENRDLQIIINNVSISEIITLLREQSVKENIFIIRSDNPY